MKPPPANSPNSNGIRFILLAVYVLFALVSAWFFLSYQRTEGGAYWGDPRTYPNSLLVRFTLGEYLETFGPWQGFDAIPLLDWVVISTTTILILGSGIFLTRGPAMARRFGSLWSMAILGLLSLVLMLVLAKGWSGWQADIVVADEIAPAFLGMCVLGGFALWKRRSPKRHRDAKSKSILPLLVIMPVFALLGLALLSASTPATQSDGVRYHLGALQVWWQRGDMSSIDGMAFSHFPYLIEMWMSWGARFDDPDIGAKLMNFALLPILLFMVGGFASALASWSRETSVMRRRIPLLAVILAVTTPALLITSTWSFIDTGVVLFALAATFAHALWWHTGKLLHLALAAALAGFMIGTKYTAIVPAFVLGIGVLACGGPTLFKRRYSLLDRLKHGLIFGVISLALASPWYLRNWHQTGNPVYPLANSIFQADGWDEESQSLWQEKAGQKGVGTEAWRMPAAWWGATFRWAGGEGVGAGGFEDQSIGLTPWLLFPLGLIGLLIITWRLGGWWQFYLIFLFLNWALWFKTYQSNRLLLSTLIVALPGMVVGLAHLTAKWKQLWVAAMITLGVAAVYQGLWIARYFMIEQYPLQLALGFWDGDDWRSSRLNYFDGARAIEALVPDEERTLVIGESRRFHFPANVVMSDWFDPPAVRRYIEGATTREEMTQAMRSDGITHVFINHPELFPLWRSIPTVLRADHTVNAEMYWRQLPPRGSNLQMFRDRFSDNQRQRLINWLSTVPHEVVWHGETVNTVGVELWRLTD